MSEHQAIATVPDAGTAKLLAEVLSDGGIEDVEIQATTGIAYMPRASALDYEIRVPLEAVARARRVLDDFEEQSGQAASSQAADVLPIETDELDARADTDVGRRKPWVMWVVLVLAIVLLGPILFNAFSVVMHFIRGLFGSTTL